MLRSFLCSWQAMAVALLGVVYLGVAAIRGSVRVERNNALLEAYEELRMRQRQYNQCDGSNIDICVRLLSKAEKRVDKLLKDRG